ncbi:MAG: hypothetical protein D6766_06395 [Verrucomicrobia bacterium]|nr:MAG: hypothetical protein D6766_06395 [Verrucomicrobiota bacterium]
MGSPATERPANDTAAPGGPGGVGWPRVLAGATTVLLAAAAWVNTHRLNTDGIAYLRLAGYYVDGPVRLAISGYWGPLLSWLLAPALAAGLEPLAAARVVMALTGLVFAGGCAVLLRVLGLRRQVVLAGSGLAGLAAVGWSVEFISPDLLVAGLMALALAATVRPRWAAGGGGAFLAGVVWGLAYLAKAVALPFAVVAVPLTAWWLRARRPDSAARWGRALALTAMGWLLTAGPWVGLLSAKYGRLTFSTAAKAAHAVVGPPDQERYHPFARRLHHPEPGRLTSWEDPTSLPYADWSPFASREYFLHQVRVSWRNLGTAAWLLGRLDLLHLGVLALAGLAAAGWVRRRQTRRHDADSRGKTAAAASPRHGERVAKGLPAGEKEPQAAPAMPGLAIGLVCLWTVCLVAVYLPGYLERVDLRYFYAAWPWLFAATALAAERLGVALAPRSPLLARMAWPLALISFAAPPVIQGTLALRGLPQPAAILARELAEGIRRTGRPGPLAGSGLLGGDRAGLFAAFFLGQPWYGDQPGARPADWAAVGARWVVLSARRPEVRELAADPRFRERTWQVLTGIESPERWLRVFENNEPRPAGRGP